MNLDALLVIIVKGPFFVAKTICKNMQKAGAKKGCGWRHRIRMCHTKAQPKCFLFKTCSFHLT